MSWREAAPDPQGRPKKTNFFTEIASTCIYAELAISNLVFFWSFVVVFGLKWSFSSHLSLQSHDS